MKTFITCSFFLYSFSSFAVIMLSQEATCPQKFVGKIINVQEAPLLVSSKLEKKIVTFSVSEKVRGSLEETVDLTVLKHGPNTFNVDETYEIEMNNGLLCMASKKD